MTFSREPPHVLGISFRITNHKFWMNNNCASIMQWTSSNLGLGLRVFRPLSWWLSKHDSTRRTANAIVRNLPKELTAFLCQYRLAIGKNISRNRLYLTLLPISGHITYLVCETRVPARRDSPAHQRCMTDAYSRLCYAAAQIPTIQVRI
jgi:hypothetical protein